MIGSQQVLHNLPHNSSLSSLFSSLLRALCVTLFFFFATMSKLPTFIRCLDGRGGKRQLGAAKTPTIQRKKRTTNNQKLNNDEQPENYSLSLGRERR